LQIINGSPDRIGLYGRKIISKVKQNILPPFIMQITGTTPVICSLGGIINII